MRLAHQNHFGSQCAIESVYRYLPAKVELKKSHFGKQSFTECALRRPPCQSELAEAPTVLCDPPRAGKNDQSNRATVCQNKDAGTLASRQYTPRAMPSSATMEGTISSEMERTVRGVSFAASENLQLASLPAKPAFHRMK